MYSPRCLISFSFHDSFALKFVSLDKLLMMIIQSPIILPSSCKLLHVQIGLLWSRFVPLEGIISPSQCHWVYKNIFSFSGCNATFHGKTTKNLLIRYIRIYGGSARMLALRINLHRRSFKVCFALLRRPNYSRS